MRSLLKVILLVLVAASIVFAAKAPPAKPSKPAQKPPAKSKPAPKKPAPLPKLIDLGAGWCQPCKMMKPVLDELRKEYKGQLDVVYIDVDKDKNAGSKYSIRVIPTQVFMDAKGKEFNRHEGYMSKQDIVDQFKARGYNLKRK